MRIAAAAICLAAACLTVASIECEAQFVHPDARLRVQAPPQQQQPAPPGFIWNQMRAGVRWGGYGALVGLVGGSVAVKGSDGELDALAYPLAGAAIGYLIGAPIGVYRYSTRYGVNANPLAAAAGGLVGTLGIVGFGFPVIFTVPLGAAWAHNKASR
jgi:hypothetical protein